MIAPPPSVAEDPANAGTKVLNFVAPQARDNEADNIGSTRSVEGSLHGQAQKDQLDEELVVVEVCCVCARLTKICQRKGMKSIGVDWSGCKDKPEGRVIWINLATSKGLEDLKEILRATKPSQNGFYVSTLWDGP